ncbi:dihydrodipicolinate synthase family protein [Rothia nasimurium]|uniref:dihydrodipicolinate synthase family protein n=1 Tax=Rothia nasimurium TaxID=85336 RepID=UPI003B9EAF52
MLKEAFHVAVPTAFAADEALDTAATLKHIGWLISKDINSVMVCGSTGEQHSLSPAEKLELLAALGDLTTPQGFELLFGAASVRLRDTTQLVKELQEAAHITGIVLGFPPYIRPSQNEATYYVREVADHTSKPIVLYNNPARTGFNLAPETLEKLSDLPNLAGIKEAADPTQIKTISEILPHLPLYAGGEVGLSDRIQAGCSRLSSIGGNLYPQEVKTWFEALLLQSDSPCPEHLHTQLTELYSHQVLPRLKAELPLVAGHSLGSCRLPLGADS